MMLLLWSLQAGGGIQQASDSTYWGPDHRHLDHCTALRDRQHRLSQDPWAERFRRAVRAPQNYTHKSDIKPSYLSIPGTPWGRAPYHTSYMCMCVCVCVCACVCRPYTTHSYDDTYIPTFTCGWSDGCVFWLLCSTPEFVDHVSSVPGLQKIQLVIACLTGSWADTLCSLIQACPTLVNITWANTFFIF